LPQAKSIDDIVVETVDDIRLVVQFELVADGKGTVQADPDLEPGGGNDEQVD
jgi:hypothetical protein